MDIILYSLMAAFVLLTAYVVFLNWNPAVKTKLFTSLLIGTFAILGLVYWELKDERFTDAFRTSFTVNNSSYVPVYVFPVPPSKMFERQLTFHMMGRSDIHYKVDGVEKHVHIYDTPQSIDQANHLYGEMLQYYLVKLMLQSQRPVIPLGGSSGGGQFYVETMSSPKKG